MGIADRDWLGELRPRVVSYSRALCRRFPQLDAEDVAQEALRRAYSKSLGGSCPVEQEALPFWLFGIARNVFLEEQRRARRGPCLDPPAELVAPTGEDHDQTELLALLDKAMNELPPSEQVVVKLRYLQSSRAPFRQIAALLGVSIATAARIEQRALVRLRRALGPDWMGEPE
jgi:RNA polymerase sigma factor (sigma-70 family)